MTPRTLNGYMKRISVTLRAENETYFDNLEKIHSTNSAIALRQSNKYKNRSLLQKQFFIKFISIFHNRNNKKMRFSPFTFNKKRRVEREEKREEKLLKYFEFILFNRYISEL